MGPIDLLAVQNGTMPPTPPPTPIPHERAHRPALFTVPMPCRPCRPRAPYLHQRNPRKPPPPPHPDRRRHRYFTHARASSALFQATARKCCGWSAPAPERRPDGGGICRSRSRPAQTSESGWRLVGGRQYLFGVICASRQTNPQIRCVRSEQEFQPVQKHLCAIILSYMFYILLYIGSLLFALFASGLLGRKKALFDVSKMHFQHQFSTSI